MCILQERRCARRARLCLLLEKKTVSLLTAAIFPIPITAQSGRAIFNLSAGGLIVLQPRRFLEEVGHDSS